MEDVDDRHDRLQGHVARIHGLVLHLTATLTVAALLLAVTWAVR